MAAALKHNIGFLGAIIAFFGFSALIPLLLLLIYGASMLIPQTSIQQFFSDVLASYVPVIPDAKLYLVQNVSRLVHLDPKVGIFGVIGLLWSTVGGFVSLQQILDIIWETHHRRTFVRQYLMGFGMLGILLLMTMISALATALSPTLLQSIMVRPDTVSWLEIVHVVARFTFPVILFLTSYFCYRFLPSYSLKNSQLIIGAFVATVGIYISRELFAWHTGHLGQYEMIYGSLTFIMLFIFWLYIVSIILLFGAEVARALHTLEQRKHT